MKLLRRRPAESYSSLPSGVKGIYVLPTDFDAAVLPEPGGLPQANGGQVDNSCGTCRTGKIRYANEAEAQIALVRVQAQRAKRPERRPPERMTYECWVCHGWHLSSKPPPLPPEEEPRDEAETWEAYARRLERRIKGQRDQLESLNKHRIDAGNRHERKRIEMLTMALGRITEKWEVERAAKQGLIEKLLLVEHELARQRACDRER